MLIIKILMVVFTILMILIALFLSSHIETPFIKISNEYLSTYQRTTRFMIILFIFTAIFSFATLFFNSKTLCLSALLLGSICSAYYAIFISKKFNV